MQRRAGSQRGECREKSGLARDEIALVHKTNGSYRRRGPTDTKRRDVGIGDEVLQPEESPRCARVLASPRPSIPEHLWPAPDEFGNAGDRQNSFAECGVTIFDSIRRCGPDIPAGWIRSAARRTDFAMGIAVR